MAAALTPPEQKGSNDTNENNEMSNLIVKGSHDNAESELILQGRYKEWDSTKVFSVQGEHKKKNTSVLHMCSFDLKCSFSALTQIQFLIHIQN